MQGERFKVQGENPINFFFFKRNKKRKDETPI